MKMIMPSSEIMITTVSQSLIQAGFRVHASLLRGIFTGADRVSLMIGVEDEKVDEAIQSSASAQRQASRA